jgi:hypothetical protein
MIEPNRAKISELKGVLDDFRQFLIRETHALYIFALYIFPTARVKFD